MTLPTFGALRRGGKQALSHTLAELEQNGESAQICQLLDEAYNEPLGHVIGITGPPGVGKSTLTNVLVKLWRAQGLTVGIIAVDPSSHQSGGALLGDRTRMSVDPEDRGVFMRSLASRGNYGGLAELCFPAMILMRALYDRVIVETVGVGQSEADISSAVDTVLLCVQPGSGDSLQFMKAGIMEIPHIAVITKADFGEAAQRAAADLEGALSLSAIEAEQWPVKVLTVSARDETGLDALLSGLDEHYNFLLKGNLLAVRRIEQAKNWAKSRFLTVYGTQGHEKIKPIMDNIYQEKDIMRPFSLYRAFSECITISVKPISH